MLGLTTEQRTAISDRSLMLRFFIWVEAIDPDTGDPDPRGFWNDIGDIGHDGRTYQGSGNLISVSTLGAKGDMTIPGLAVTLSGIADAGNLLVRGKEIAQAPISVMIGLFDPATHNLIPPLFPYFVGVIDDCLIRTPEAGGEASIVFTCESASRALTRTSRATRSPASEAERDPGDHFYAYTAVQRDKPLYFGRAAPNAPSVQGRVGSGFAGGIARA